MFEQPLRWLDDARAGRFPAASLVRRFVLPAIGDALAPPELARHGGAHMRRVALYAEILAYSYGADPRYAALAGWCHDCVRTSDGREAGHGWASWQRAEPVLRQRFTDLPWESLREGVVDHSDGRLSDDPLVAALWDADRIDLMRFGKPPRLSKLDRKRFSRPEIALDLAATVIHLDFGFAEAW